MLYHGDKLRSGPTKDIEGGGLARRDADKWKEAIVNKIMNFLKQNAWKKVPMSQVLRKKRVTIPTESVFKIKDEQDGSKWYKA